MSAIRDRILLHPNGLLSLSLLLVTLLAIVVVPLCLESPGVCPGDCDHDSATLNAGNHMARQHVAVMPAPPLTAALVAPTSVASAARAPASDAPQLETTSRLRI